MTMSLSDVCLWDWGLGLGALKKGIRHTTNGGPLSGIRVVPGPAGTNGPDAWPRFHTGPLHGGHRPMGVKRFIQSQVIYTNTRAGNGLGWCLLYSFHTDVQIVGPNRI